MSQVMRWLPRHIRDPLYSNSIFLIANTAIVSALGFAFWIIVARFYSEYEVGWGAAIISAISLLALFSRLGLNMALIRFLPKAENPVALINSCFTLNTIVSLALAAIFVVSVDLWSPALGFINDDPTFAIAFIFFTLFWTLSEVIDYVFIARRRADFVLKKNVIFSVLKIPIPIIMVSVFSFHAFGIVSSWGIATGIAVVIALFFFLSRVQRGYRVALTINLGIIKDMWRYSMGNYFAVLFGAAPNFLLPLIIVNRLSPGDNAYFYVAWMVISLLFIIPSSVSQSLFAEGSHFEDDLGNNVQRSYRFIFVLLVPAIVVLVLLGKWVLLAFGETYSENALPLLRLLALSGIFVGINNIYCTVLQVRNRIRELVAVYAFITTAVLVGSYLLVPTTGIIGVAYIWIVAQGLVSVYVLCSSKLRRGLITA